MGARVCFREAEPFSRRKPGVKIEGKLPSFETRQDVTTYQRGGCVDVDTWRHRVHSAVQCMALAPKKSHFHDQKEGKFLSNTNGQQTRPSQLSDPLLTHPPHDKITKCERKLNLRLEIIRASCVCSTQRNRCIAMIQNCRTRTIVLLIIWQRGCCVVVMNNVREILAALFACGLCIDNGFLATALRTRSPPPPTLAM